MDRTERLFAIIDSLRRHRRPVTAASLAGEHGVSVRTLYRDVQVLIGLGAPIEGEAGIGYVLRHGFFLPPLMFKPEELEALVLGARFVEGQADAALARAATQALAKIATAGGEDLRDRIGDAGLWPKPPAFERRDMPLLATIREAMRSETVLDLVYVDESGAETVRPVWPVALAYDEGRHIVAAWCLLRNDYRHFRVDRVRSAALGSERFGRRRAAMLGELNARWASRRSAGGGEGS